MRMLMHVHLPLEPFNTAVRDGSAGQEIKRIIDAAKPEAVYFCEHNGQRGAANGKCRAKTKAGGQCAAPAVRGGIYCALHNDPDRAAQLGRKGGANNRKVYEGNDREIPPPQNACDVKNSPVRSDG